MSASENSEPVDPDFRRALQARLDDLVGQGRLTPCPGKQLTVGEDGLPELVDSKSTPKPAINRGCREMLSQIIQYLESHKGPQSTSWIDASLKLRKLRDLDYETTLCPLTKAWEIVSTADGAAKEDINYMERMRKYIGLSPRIMGPSMFFTVLDDSFPQRACRLFGIETSSDYHKDVWDGGLDEQMAEKDFNAYLHVRDTWSSILALKRKGPIRCSLGLDCARTHLEDFLMLENIKSTTEVMNMKPFVLLKLKAKRVARSKPPQQLKG